jgi:ParB/RepB/Spo0J family partition protein
MINLPINGQVVDVHISHLLADPDQPRKTFAEDSLQALSDSIAKSGILVPLLVRRAEADGMLIIHDGERRYRAAQLAKLETVPVIVTTAGENVRLEQFAMNNLREQLKPMEIARMLADMQRKQFASTNELAAHLDRSGLPAMTPKEIDETISLVDLPEWLQGMIDVNQVEVSAAVQVRKVEHLPEVLAWVKEAIEEDAAMGGKATSRDVDHAIDNAAYNMGADLSIERWRSNPPHFNVKKICKGCEFKLTAGHTSYCMNPPEFERKNAEAKAAGLLPGGKKPKQAEAGTGTADQVDTEVKAVQRARTLLEKARDYLHAYLVHRIVTFMQDGDSETMTPLIDITDELLAWHAMRHPGQSSYGGRAAIPPYESRTALGVASIDALLGKNMGAAKLHAAMEVATELKWRETQVICHHLWGSAIEKVWTMDEAFTKLFRKAELLQLVADHDLGLDGDRKWEKLKQADLRAEILDRAWRVTKPKILQQIYADVDEPYVPYSYRFEEEEQSDVDFEEDEAA